MRSTSVVDAELCEEKTMPITFVESRGLLNFTVSYSVHRTTGTDTRLPRAIRPGRHNLA